VERQTVLTKVQAELAFSEGDVSLSLSGGRASSRPLAFWGSHRSLSYCPRAALLFACSAFFGAAIQPADDPGAVLKRNFESAKSALAAGDFSGAERDFKQTIALGLRQLGNLSVSEARYDEAARELDEALKFAPDDADTMADAAIATFRAGDVKKARQLAQSVVAANPRHARAQNVLGRIDLYRGDFDAAIRELQASVAVDEDFETSYFLGIAYLKAKRLSDAQQWFRHLQDTMGDSGALHVLIGRAYSIGHFPEPAVAEFRKAIQLEPKYPRAHALLGYAILEFRGDEAYPQARLEFERELKLHPDDYNALLLLGLSAVALRDFPAAEAALVHASRLRPKESFAYLYLGETYSETKRLAQAVEVLEKYIRLVPDPESVPRDVSRAYYLLGQNLRRLGRVEEAQKALANSQRYREAKFRYDAQHIFDEPKVPADGDSRSSDRIASLLESGGEDQKKSAEAIAQGAVPETPAVRPQPTVPQAKESKALRAYHQFASEVLASAYNDLGVMRAKESKFAEASEFFKQAAAWNPSLPGLDRNWGFASFKAEQYTQAVPPLERCLAAHPDDAFVRQLLGLSYFIEEKYPKTVEVLQPFSKNPPDDPGLLFAWGTALVRTRQSEAAGDIFRRLLLQNANNASVHFLLGQAYAQQEDYANASSELKSALQLDPHLPEAHYYAGLVYLHQSQFEVAAGEFRSELELRPEDLMATYHLGYALLMEGQLPQAVTVLHRVVEVKPDYEPAQFELGRALLQQGDASEAVQHLEIATRLAPEHDAAFFQLSQGYRRAGRIPEATSTLAQYQRLIEANRMKKRESLEMEKP
jgi:tetratricopeptide (TPR) repeat protein